MIKLIFGIIDDTSLLPYFLEWYKEQGVDQFIINIVDSVEDNAIIEDILHKSKNYNLIINSVFYGRDDNLIQAQNREKAQEKYTNNNDWIIFADLDEFHEYPGGMKNFLKSIEGNYNLVKGVFIDRLTENGKFEAYNDQEDLFEQYPIKSDISYSILKVPGPRVSAVRGLAHRGSMHISKNPLYQDNMKVKICPQVIKINHFKWRHGVVDRTKKRLEHFIRIGGSRAVIRESKRLLKHFGNKQ